MFVHNHAGIASYVFLPKEDKYVCVHLIKGSELLSFLTLQVCPLIVGQ